MSCFTMKRRLAFCLSIVHLVALIAVFPAATALAGPAYDYDAEADAARPNDTTWESETSATAVRTWDFQGTGGANAAAKAVDPADTATTVRWAFDFGGPETTDPVWANTGSFYDSDINDGDNTAAFEVWVKPNSLPTTGTINPIFETGGDTNGLSIVLDGPQLTVNSRSGDDSVVASSTLNSADIADFLHVMAVSDGPANQTRLYVNGQMASFASGRRNWTAGSNDAGLAGVNSQLTGYSNSPPEFEGQIARLRFYAGDMTAREVYETSKEMLGSGSGYADAVLADDPVTYYRLGEDNGTPLAVNLGSIGAAGDGTDGGPGTITRGVPSLVPSESNTAASLDGASLINISNHGEINSASGGYAQKSIELWFNADTVPDNTAHAVLYEQGGTSNGANVYLYDDKLYAGKWGNDNDVWLSAPVNSGTNHHLVFSHDATGKLTAAYLDGVMIGASGDATNLGRHTGGVAIGGVSGDTLYQDSEINGSNIDFFEGTIDELVTYNESLSIRRVQERHAATTGDRLGVTSGATPFDATLGVAFNWDAATASSDTLWEDTVGTIPDTGRPQDMNWNLTGATLNTTGVSEHPGITAAFAFDGSGSGGLHPDDFGSPDAYDSWEQLLPGGAGNFDQKSATFEMWFKPSDVEGSEVLFETGGSIDGTSIVLSGDLLQFVAKDGGERSVAEFDLDADDDTVLDTDDFIQAVAVTDLAHDRVRLFVNGRLAEAVEFTGLDWMGSDGAGLARVDGALGGSGSAVPFDGEIGIFRYYPWALSSLDVKVNYAAVTGTMLPEPSSLALLAIGIVGLAVRRRRKA